MDGSPVLPVWGVFMLAVPLIGFLVMVIFGVDECLFTPKRNPGRRRFFCEVGGNGGSFVSDPDGTAWQKGPVRQVEGRLIRVDDPGRDGLLPGATPDRASASFIRGYIIEK